jgi:hypothetical protein
MKEQSKHFVPQEHFETSPALKCQAVPDGPFGIEPRLKKELLALWIDVEFCVCIRTGSGAT